MKRVLVLGVGNDFRGDDAAGRLAARAIKAAGAEPAEVREAGGESTGLMSAWTGCEAVILIDAMQSGSPPGTILRFDAHAGPLPASFSSQSTHAFGVAEAVELARALGQLPPTVVVYGIEGESYGMGEPVSGEVLRAIDQVRGKVLYEIWAILARSGNENEGV